MQPFSQHKHHAIPCDGGSQDSTAAGVTCQVLLGQLPGLSFTLKPGSNEIIRVACVEYALLQLPGQ